MRSLAMGLEVLEIDVNPNLIQDVDDFVDEENLKVISVDSRRRLEEKIEELRLIREMQEFDFDD